MGGHSVAGRSLLGRGTVGPAVFAAAAVALMLLSSAADAASPATTVPFRSLNAQLLTITDTGACARGHVRVPGKWSWKTGELSGSGTANAPPCARQASPNAGGWQIEELFSYAFTFPSTGNHTVTIAWKVTDSATWKVTPYSRCTLYYRVVSSLCTVQAQTLIQFETMFFDQNFSLDDTYLNATSLSAYTINQSYNPCAPASWCGTSSNVTNGSSGAFLGTTNYTTVLNLTGTNAVGSTSATYYLYIYGTAEAYAEAYSRNSRALGHASASASLDVAGGSLGMFLQSITIT